MVLGCPLPATRETQGKKAPWVCGGMEGVGLQSGMDLVLLGLFDSGRLL